MNTVDWLKRFKLKVIQRVKSVRLEYAEEEIEKVYQEILEEMISPRGRMEK